jgi:hypothetical protein
MFQTPPDLFFVKCCIGGSSHSRPSQKKTNHSRIFIKDSTIMSYWLLPKRVNTCRRQHATHALNQAQPRWNFVRSGHWNVKANQRTGGLKWEGVSTEVDRKLITWICCPI